MAIIILIESHNLRLMLYIGTYIILISSSQTQTPYKLRFAAIKLIAKVIRLSKYYSSSFDINMDDQIDLELKAAAEAAKAEARLRASANAVKKHSYYTKSGRRMVGITRKRHEAVGGKDANTPELITESPDGTRESTPIPEIAKGMLWLMFC